MISTSFLLNSGPQIWLIKMRPCRVRMSRMPPRWSLPNVTKVQNLIKKKREGFCLSDSIWASSALYIWSRRLLIESTLVSVWETWLATRSIFFPSCWRVWFWVLVFLVYQFKTASYCFGSSSCPEAVTGDWTQEVWDLVEVVEEKICKMFLDEKVFFFFFFLLIISSSSSTSVSSRQGQSGLHIWASGISHIK